MRYRFGKNARLLSGAVALAVSTIALPAGAANLLENPGFESPTDSSGSNTDITATGWTFYGGDAVRANTFNHTPGGQWSIFQQTNLSEPGGIYQNVGAIDPGSGFNLSCYYYFEDAESSVPNEVSDLALTFLNNADQVVGPVDSNGYSDATYIPSSSQTTTNTWMKYSVSGAAPAGATQVQVSFDFTGGSPAAGGTQGAFVDDADLEPVEGPLPTQWVSNGSGDWNISGNWSTGTIPNAAGAEADFFGAITSPQTVYTNAPITAGMLHFNNASEYVIAGAGSLTLQAGNSFEARAIVQVDQGTDELDLPVTLASNTVFDIASGATLIVANPLTIISGATLMQTGGGTVTYQSDISVEPSASIAFGNSTHAHELSIASGSTAFVTGTGTVLEVDSLANSGTLDLQNNTLLINYGNSADPIASIRAELISGYDGGTWNGPGINSGTAQIPANAPYYGLGYADGADGVVAGLASGLIEVKYTLLGDANLDGVVNGDDFTILAANLGKSVAAWDKGDFNYDGVVSGDDFTLLITNLGKESNGGNVILPASDYAAIDAFAAANGLMADVPEPASASLVLVGCMGAFTHRLAKLGR